MTYQIFYFRSSYYRAIQLFQNLWDANMATQKGRDHLLNCTKDAITVGAFALSIVAIRRYGDLFVV